MKRDFSLKIDIIVLYLTIQMRGVLILSLMGKSNNRVFVYKDMPDISTKKNIDIILTPQLYIHF